MFASMINIDMLLNICTGAIIQQAQDSTQIPNKMGATTTTSNKNE